LSPVFAIGRTLVLVGEKQDPYQTDKEASAKDKLDDTDQPICHLGRALLAIATLTAVCGESTFGTSGNDLIILRF
jgi:hypothetical protein